MSSAVVFAVMWGMVNGFENNTMGLVMPNYFGRKHLGAIRGAAMATLVFASALGPLPFGIAYDTLQSYQFILLCASVVPLAGACAAWFAPKPIRKPGSNIVSL